MRENTAKFLLQYLIDEIEPGVWTIKTGKFIPDHERWLWTAETQAQIDRAIAWAEQHPPTETDLESLAGRIGIRVTSQKYA